MTPNMNPNDKSADELAAAVETVSTLPIVRKLFGYEKEDIDTVLAALASAQRDGARYLYAYAQLSGRTFKDAAVNAPHISDIDIAPILAAMSKEPTP